MLTHGAGANCESLLLRTLADAFCEAGLLVLRCDLAFRQQRPKGPPPRGSAERDQQGLRRSVEVLRRELASGARVFLGGHSYGGRQASMLAASEPELAEALLLLSYPLHPPKKPEQIRTAHLPDLRTPALFVHGARDEFATSLELKAASQLIQTRTEIMEFESVGHELVSAKNAGVVASRVRDIFLDFAGM